MYIHYPLLILYHHEYYYKTIFTTSETTSDCRCTRGIHNIFIAIIDSSIFSIQFGVSKITINCLSLTALLIFLYSSVFYLTLKTVHWRILLSIAIVKDLYCLLTLALMIYQHSELKLLGILYFSIEIAVIIFLIVIEYKIKQKRNGQ